MPSPNELHKIHIESTPATDVVSESTINCKCGFKSHAFPQFVHAVVQRHIQMAANDASLEITKDF